MSIRKSLRNKVKDVVKSPDVTDDSADTIILEEEECRMNEEE